MLRIAEMAGGMTRWQLRTENVFGSSWDRTAAVAGAVVSKPAATKTTSRPFLASETASCISYTTRTSAPCSGRY